MLKTIQVGQPDAEIPIIKHLVAEREIGIAANRRDACRFANLLPYFFSGQYEHICIVDSRLDLATVAAMAHAGGDLATKVLENLMLSNLIRFAQPAKRVGYGMESITFLEIGYERKVYVISAEPLFFVSLTDEVWR